jgi:hypothetical protein
LLIYVFLSAAVTEVVWEGEETETKKVESQDSKKKAENTAVTNTVNNRSNYYIIISLACFRCML